MSVAIRGLPCQAEALELIRTLELVARCAGLQVAFGR